VAEPELSFAGLLRQLRAEAKLTQEELAEAAGLSPRSVSDLERGITRTAHKDTGVLLAGALSLPGPVRELFVAAARGKTPAAEVLTARQEVPQAFAAAASRALPRDIAAFTGRQAELAQLMGMLAAAAAGGGVVQIHAIDGMPGIGKTTFAVHAAHRLAGTFPDGQFFLPLHAHTPGRRPVDPADALASLLLTAGVPAGQVPSGLDARAGQWRGYLAGKKILLLLDDAAGHEQIQPLLPGTAGSLVLITSRRRLAALHDAAVLSLDIFPPAEAGTLLARLAARPGLRATDAAVGEITRLCGYLPLAIGMLASQLRHRPAWTAARLAADLAAARDRLARMHAENLSVAAAFGLSYAELTPGPQRLFRRLGLVPGTTIDAYAAAALDDTSLAAARRHLEELYNQHLLSEPAPGRYLLHDLLREHARALAAADIPADCQAAAARLLDYYLHAALAAGTSIPVFTAVQGRPPPGRRPAHLPDVSTLDRAAAWLEAERPNLAAAADYAAASSRHLHAVQIPAAVGDFLRAHGDWDQALELHRTALTAARCARDTAGQALALRQLGIVSWLQGDFAAAADLLAQAAELYRAAGDKPGEAYVLSHIGKVQELTGDYPAAIASRQRALDIARSVPDPLVEANALVHLSETYEMIEDHQAAARCLRQALDLFRGLGNRLGEADSLGGLGRLQRQAGDYQASIASSRGALAIYRELQHRPFQPAILSDLGETLQLAGDFDAALDCLTQSLEQCRDLGIRLGQTGTLNKLGELACRTSHRDQARRHHRAALAIARDMAAPLEEARALEGLGQACLPDGNTDEAVTYLRQALDIYQRIGAPAAQRVQAQLREGKLAWSGSRPVQSGAAGIAGADNV
jgi:tetratricopeptide (TPR) repeat protein/transcriptional regulator with XRE-family HTH domain